MSRIQLEVRDHVARLVLDHPERRNAMRFDMWRDLADAVEGLEQDDSVRVVILTGAGEQAFCAGNDISEFEHWHATPALRAEYDSQSTRAAVALKTFSKPLIGRIRGVCVGGGFELAQLCDIQIASEDSRFGVTPARLGIGYKLHDVLLLTGGVEARFIRELLFTGRIFAAAEAMRMGLVNRIVPAADLDEVVDGYARDIAANAPLSVRAAKLVIKEAVKVPHERDEALCDEVVGAANLSEDSKEGARAFGEKRPPRFTGR